ncbi:MAG TPA: hypothetical protein VE988_29140 [Gemmataceae bacterium]|nr:hypothetical protein [Gemmataceae bacterium]
MNRASLALCAVGGFLLGLAGCTALDLGLDMGLPAAEAAGEVRVVDGKPADVALTLQATLKKAGLEATVVPDGATVVVQSKSKSGLQFALMLKSQRAADGREQTHVSMEWLDNRKDQQTSVQVFTELDRQTKR